MFEKKLSLKKVHDQCGSKTPRLAVIFVHGIAADSSSFANAIKYLEGTRSLKDVRFIAFDLLGSGKSMRSDKLEYDYSDQLEALHNSIEKLKLDIPIVMVGHSMGTLIATHYADKYKKSIKELILISPPIYTERDLLSPAFKAGMKMFTEGVSLKNRGILEEKSFNNSMKKIVLNPHNYKTLVGITTPTILIYGNLDQFIASYNIPSVLEANPKYIVKAIKTEGRHGVSRDKYTKLVSILEEALNAETV